MPAVRLWLALLAWPAVCVGGWRAGVAKAAITPTESIWMAGYEDRAHPSEGVSQALYVKALALEADSGKPAVLVTADLLGFPREVSDAIAARCEKEFALSRDRLALNASGTHSGPVVHRHAFPIFNLEEKQWQAIDRYSAFLIDKTVGVIGAALHGLAPATLRFGQGVAGIAVDHDVPVLAIEGADGGLRAILVGYARSGTVLHSYQISGDWLGFAQESIEKRRPGVMALFVQGCGADASPSPRGSVELARRYGQTLSAAVEDVLRSPMKSVEGPLRTAFEAARLPFQNVPTREELAANAPHRQFDIVENYGAYDALLKAPRQLFENLLDMARDGKFPDSGTYPVQVWQFGRTLKWIALPGEVVVDYSLRLKSQFGADNTWVAGSSNDAFGYLPSARVLREGGYAATRSGYIAPFSPAVEELIVEKVADLLNRTSASAKWDPVPTVDLGRLHVSDFRDNELDLPFYLARFKELADRVVEQGPNRGFIDSPVWRPVTPNNARVMESVLSLTYFYTLKRPWNPYYASPAVRQRLEAALEFWLRLQSPEGRFPETGPQQWTLIATAFFTKFMSPTLALLKDGPPVDHALIQRAIEADRKTIRLVLTDPELYRRGAIVSSQYTGVFAGGFQFVKLFPDAQIEDLLRRRFLDSMRDEQSPAGFFYEQDGPDFSFDLLTHHTNLETMWYYVRGTEISKMLAEQERKWFEWLAWNAVPDGNWSGWITNQGIHMRTRRGFIQGKDTPIGEIVPEARAFATARENLPLEIAAQRQKLAFFWPTVPALQPASYSPYAFMLHDNHTWYPTGAEREEARRRLPYFARQEFTRQLMDDRHPLVFTYVRRPGYYAAFNSGKHLASQQRYGLGLLWSRDTGAVLQTQAGSSTAAWGTAAAGAPLVYEAGDVEAVFRIAGQAVQPKPGSTELPAGALTITYPLGSKGEKSIEFAEDSIVVTVRHAGEFTEFLPLLQIGGEIPAGFTVSIDSPATAGAEPTATEVCSRKLSVMRVKAKDMLVYRLRFTR